MFTTLERRQSKTLMLSTSVDQKSSETAFGCHLSPDWRQMAIENTVANDFYPRLSIVKRVFDYRLSGVLTLRAVISSGNNTAELSSGNSDFPN